MEITDYDLGYYAYKYCSENRGKYLENFKGDKNGWNKDFNYSTGT